MSMDMISIILPALLAGVIVSSTHVPLGREVLKRGIIFIDLAIAQIASLGVIIAKLYLHGYQQIAAFGFAIAAALFFKFIEKKNKQLQEAIIGCSFVVASSLGLLFAFNHPHGAEEIEAVLAGQILWVGFEQLMIAALIYSAVLFLWFRTSLGQRYFYILFALCITFSVQLIGVYLVFATLIFPAIYASVVKTSPLLKAYIYSILTYLLGIIVSVWCDLPASPAIVVGFVALMLLHLFTRRLINKI